MKRVVQRFIVVLWSSSSASLSSWRNHGNILESTTTTSHIVAQAWIITTSSSRHSRARQRQWRDSRRDDMVSARIHRQRHRHSFSLLWLARPKKELFDDDFYNSWNETDDDEDDIHTRRDLQQALGNLLTPIKTRSDAEQQQQEAYNALLVNRRQLEAMALETTQGPQDENDTTLLHDESKDDEQKETDGLFLNPDAYVESSKWLTTDGSLDLPQDAVNVPSSFSSIAADLKDDPNLPANFFRTWSERLLTVPEYPDEQLPQELPSSPSTAPRGRGRPKTTKTEKPAKREYTFEDLLQVQQQIQQQQQQSLLQNTTTSSTSSSSSAISEELHAQVFAQEEGYLAQSQIFRQALASTDTEQTARAALEAAKLRRGADYRQRQEAALQQLETQLSELNVLYKQQQKQQKQQQQQQKEKVPTDGGKGPTNQQLPPLPQQQVCIKCGCPLDPTEIQQAATRGKKLPICRVCHADELMEASSMAMTQSTEGSRNWNVIRRSLNTTSRSPSLRTTAAAGSTIKDATVTISPSLAPSFEKPSTVNNDNDIEASSGSALSDDKVDIPLRSQHLPRTRLRHPNSAMDKPILHIPRAAAVSITKGGREAALPNTRQPADDQPSLSSTSTKAAAPSTIPRGTSSPDLKSSSLQDPPTEKRKSSISISRGKVDVLKSPKKIVKSQEALMKEQEREASMRKQNGNPSTSKSPKEPTPKVNAATKAKRSIPTEPRTGPMVMSESQSKSSKPTPRQAASKGSGISPMPPKQQPEPPHPPQQQQVIAAFGQTKSGSATAVAATDQMDLASTNANITPQLETDSDDAESYSAQAQKSLESVMAMLQQLRSYNADVGPSA